MAKTFCDWTVERLPWWVNGTLEEAEAERVAAHLAECAACREELAATRGALALYSVHLPIETLLDLVVDGAAESDRAAGGAVMSRQAIDGHLAHCTACREELALLRESQAAVETEPAAPEAEAAGATVTTFAPRRAAPVRPVRDRHRFDRHRLALAASVLLFAVAAGGWLTSGLTAERRGDRIAELDRRLAEVTAARVAGEPSGESSPADGEPGETAAALAAATARVAVLTDEIAKLQAELDGPAAESGDRLAVVGVGPTLLWDLHQTVMRGAEEGPARVPLQAPADAEQISIVLSGLPDGPLRLEIEDVASGRRLEERKLIRYDSPYVGVHASITLSPADFPAGGLRLRLFAGGDEIGSQLLRIAR